VKQIEHRIIRQIKVKSEQYLAKPLKTEESRFLAASVDFHKFYNRFKETTKPIIRIQTPL
jgi:hypothetical protein